MFLTEDTVPGRASLPRSLHIYVYAWNNPINLLDPSGKQTPVPCDQGGLCATQPTGGYVVQTPWNPPPPPPPGQSNVSTESNSSGYDTDALYIYTGKGYCVFLRSEQGLHAGMKAPGVQGDLEYRHFDQFNLCDNTEKHGLEANAAVGPAMGIPGTGVGVVGEHSWTGTGPGSSSSNDVSFNGELGGFGVSAQFGDNQIVLGGGGATPVTGPTLHGYVGLILASSHRFLTTVMYFEGLGEDRFLTRWAPDERIIYSRRYPSIDKFGCFDAVERQLLLETMIAHLPDYEGYQVPEVVP